MKKIPAPRIVPAPQDFVMAHVFDLYRKLATRGFAVSAAPREAPREAPRREPRKVRETVE